MNKEKSDEYWEGYIQKQNESMEICKICRYRTKFRELEKQVEDSILTSVIREKMEELKEKTIHETDEIILIRYNIEINILEEILKKGEK